MNTQTLLKILSVTLAITAKLMIISVKVSVALLVLFAGVLASQKPKKRPTSQREKCKLSKWGGISHHRVVFKPNKTRYGFIKHNKKYTAAKKCGKVWRKI